MKTVESNSFEIEWGEGLSKASYECRALSKLAKRDEMPLEGKGWNAALRD